MSSPGLPVNRLINVSVNLTPQAAQFANVDSLCVLGSSGVINVSERIESFSSLEEMTDFGFETTDPEYLAAELFFGQTPQPTQLYVGEWAEAATSGLLIGSDLTPTQQEIATWNAITTGAFGIVIDGGSSQALTGLNFSADGNLNAVAATINAVLENATMSWTGSNFEVTSNSSGTSSTVGFATTPGSGTDISTMLRLTSATNATKVGGIAAETPVACVALFDTLPIKPYAFMFASADVTDDEHLAVAAYIEASSNPHVYGITSDDVDATDPSSTSDIGYQLKALGYNRTITQYSANPYAIASFFGRSFTVDFNQNNSTITLMYKVEPGVTADALTSTQADALDGKNYTYYTNFANATSIIVNGCMASGIFFDAVQGADWFANRVQTDLFNLLYTSPTKIPQTDAGNQQILTTAQGSCNAAVNNGLVGPGTWAYQGFGQLLTGQFLPNGYYTYMAPIATQSSADRQARKSVPLQIAAIFAGAVQTIGVTITVQR